MRKPTPPITPVTNREPLLAAVLSDILVKIMVSKTKKAKANQPIKPICVNPVKSEIKSIAPQIRVSNKSWV